VLIILGMSFPKEPGSPMMLPESSQSEKARRDLMGLTESFKNVGLAGERFQVIFAEVMNECMREYVYGDCRGVWRAEAKSPDVASILPRAAHHASPSQCVMDLCEWIENRYTKLSVQILGMLDPRVDISWTDKEKFKEMTIGHLAELRTYELFDIVASWPNSVGALDDLRTAITTPRRRLHLTEVFSQALSKNLLHPGTSTLEILQYYINMIWSFHALDHSKVLLDRVAYSLQVYVCSREDAVRIIIHGLLADVNEPQRSGDKLVELAQLLNEGSDQGGRKVHDEEMDWHDMEWVPDPVDAGPGYKRSKNADIIGTLIGVLGSQEVFIKEFQTIIGENFLKHDGNFEREVSCAILRIIHWANRTQIKVLELLKTRFGEAPLQACEVMLKDIQDSTRVNAMIRKAQDLEPSELELGQVQKNPELHPEGLLKPSLHAKILSRLFWPQLMDEEYNIPKAISTLQDSYATGFESFKSARKLTWLHGLGQATVELELQDRTVIEEVSTWQATVIWAFESDQPNFQLTVTQLLEKLEMEEPLLRTALRFWVSKLVLREISPSTYTVLENLNPEDSARSKAQTSTAGTAGGSNTHDADEDKVQGIAGEKMAIYWSYIQGMLKNSKAQMPVQQIGVMLKMLIVDGFPYGNEELKEFLNGKVEEGELECVGAKYRLKK
jgi:anaphase-promoting complex subunit 2